MARTARDILEVITAVLLGLVSVATAFGAYQASVWAGEASTYASASHQLRDRNLTEALTTQLIYLDDVQKVIDLTGLSVEATVFPERAVELQAQQDAMLRSISPSLSASWSAYVDSGFDNSLVPITTAEYEGTLFGPAQSMQYASYVAEQAADAVGARSASVTIAAVIFAIALFLLGVAGVNTNWKVAAWLTGGAAAAFIAGVVVMVLAAL